MQPPRGVFLVQRLVVDLSDECLEVSPLHHPVGPPAAHHLIQGHSAHVVVDIDVILRHPAVPPQLTLHATPQPRVLEHHPFLVARRWAVGGRGGIEPPVGDELLDLLVRDVAADEAARDNEVRLPPQVVLLPVERDAVCWRRWDAIAIAAVALLPSLVAAPCPCIPAADEERVQLVDNGPRDKEERQRSREDADGGDEDGDVPDECETAKQTHRCTRAG
mmetsp:Transcript_8966/g.22024  ORF Transcript_8966/g.22024 Transcript_8966/m.22024 type:complete len:219 (-) Transcript_8966:115-771(-)